MAVAIGQRTNGHDVNGAPQERFERVLKMKEIEQRAVIGELHQQIDVTAVGVIAPGDRTKNLDT